jgi:chorismate mutase/prephenate dehydratase
MNNEEDYQTKLEKFRKEINQIDDNLVDLLNKRGEIVKIIGEFKKQLNMDVYQPQREKEVFNRIKEKSTILRSESIEAIWKEIMSASKLIQGLITKVGFLGPKGTFTHQAALDYFPNSKVLKEIQLIMELFLLKIVFKVL